MNPILYPVGISPAMPYCTQQLEKLGISLIDLPSPEVTHLLMDVPSFHPDGTPKCSIPLDEILAALPDDIIIIGGLFPSYMRQAHAYIDLLDYDQYLYENAAITAEGALLTASVHIPFSLRHSKVLIVGWGRIGKHLASMLRSLRADVTIASHTSLHRAEAASFDYSVINTGSVPACFSSFDIVFNTVPRKILSVGKESNTPTILIDLASGTGIDGDRVIHANGLPGKYAPAASGTLMANTIYHILQEVEQ